jgi:hypothetical protein
MTQAAAAASQIFSLRGGTRASVAALTARSCGAYRRTWPRTWQLCLAWSPKFTAIRIRSVTRGDKPPVCFPRRLKRLLYGLVVLMIWVPEGNQRIEVKEVARFSRTHPQPLSPFAKSIRSHWEERLQDRSPTA